MRGNLPCWHCHHFERWHIGHYSVGPGSYAIGVCGRSKATPTVAEPQFGCVYWERMPGADDEPGCIDPAGKRRVSGKL